MSKMSNIAMQLDEKAVELGFADHLEALGNGYEWGVGQDGEAFLFKPEDEQEKAHEAWLEERDSVIESLDNAIYHNKRLNGGKGTYEAVVMQRAKDFIKEIKSE